MSVKFDLWYFTYMKISIENIVPVPICGLFTVNIYFIFFSTFFNVDPIAVAYNLNPSAEQHLPSIGKYEV